MKDINRLLFFISILIIVPFNTFIDSNVCKADSSGIPDDPLILINSNRDIYLESEPIWIEVEVNIPAEIILDRAPDIHPYGDLRFNLTERSGDTIKDLGGSVTSVLFKNYRSHYFSLFYLNNYYGVPEDSTLDFPYKTPSGEYHLQIRIQLRVADSMKYFYSNLINFRVEKPSGDEFNARNKLIEIEYLTFRTNNSKDMLNKRYEKINEFRNNYYNSRYIQKIEHLNFCNSWSDPNFKDTVKTYLSGRINEDANNYYNVIYVQNLESYYKGEENSYIDYLNQIGMAHKGTILQKIIGSYIEEFDFKRSLQNK